MEELERAQTRLDHIRIVEPILGALRTISLGSWQAALGQRQSLQQYQGQLMAILALVLPHLPAGRRRAEGRNQGAERVAVLAVGSERGLVGRFNATVARRVDSYLAEIESSGVQIELMVLGTRLRRSLRVHRRSPDWFSALPVSALPSYRLVLELTHRCLVRYEQYELDAVRVIYNAYRGTGQTETRVVRLISPQLPGAEQRGGEFYGTWPPPIIETDPLSLYVHAARQWIAVRLHEILLDSAAAEHSTRYQLMESASRNAERLILELTLVVQSARRQRITREMQDLAAGAGLIRPR
jgi:F-type H+-transporting ATPase subunit gamma